MILRRELEKYKQAAGLLNVGQLEKDYLQHAALIFLFENADLVFKGGTCLQKCYGLPRFSEDLDFDSLSGIVQIEAAVEKTDEGLDALGCEAEFRPDKKQFPNAFSGKFAVKGPLYDGSERSLAFVSVDARVEKPLLQTRLATINPPYPDLRQYAANIMSLDEILAEKVRAVCTRSEPRDAFDLNFLFAKYSLKPDYRIIQKKMDYYGKTFSKKEFMEKLGALEKVFQKEMTKLARSELVPEFGQVQTNLRNAFQ